MIPQRMVRIDFLVPGLSVGKSDLRNCSTQRLTTACNFRRIQAEDHADITAKGRHTRGCTENSISRDRRERTPAHILHIPGLLRKTLHPLLRYRSLTLARSRGPTRARRA